MACPCNFENSFAVALVGLAPRSAVRTEAPIECLGAPSSSATDLRRILTNDSKEVGAVGRRGIKVVGPEALNRDLGQLSPGPKSEVLRRAR